MDELISRQKTLERLEWKRPEIGADGSRDRHRYMQWMADMDAVECTPPAQPERKKGKWTKENACEFCGFKPWFERDIHTLSFCPNCGADLREEGRE